jgi:hypothetical protein
VREKQQQLEACEIKDFRGQKTHEENFQPVGLPNLSLCAHLLPNWQYNLRKSPLTEAKVTSDFMKENT